MKTKPAAVTAKYLRVGIEVLPKGGYLVGSYEGGHNYVIPVAAFETFPSMVTWLKKHVVPA